MRIKHVLVSLILVFGYTKTKSQNFVSWLYDDRYFSLSVGTGKVGYIGELNSKYRFQNALANFNTGLEVRLWSQVAARVETGFYNLIGQDYRSTVNSFEQQRNLSFRSWNFETSLQGVFYFKKYRGDFYKRWRIDPYLAAGVGFTTFNPYTGLNGTKYYLRDFQTEGVKYGNTTLTIPLGIGAKFKLNEFLNFIVEGAYRFTFTDYLDDVSGNFIDVAGDNVRNSLSNRKSEVGIINQEAYDLLIPGNPRGDASNNDGYMFINLKLEVYLPNRKGPIISKPSAY